MRFFGISVFMLVFSWTVVAQSPVGIWKTIDDEDGSVKSYVEIFEKEDKLYGKVIEVLDPTASTNCTKCKGDKKDQAIEGLEIIWDMKAKGDEWKGGKILDPKNGKEYKCKMSLEDENTLKVRGFIGFSLIGRTQTWYRKEK